MTIRSVGLRHHRGHLSITLVVAIVSLATACGGGTVPAPRHVQVRAEDYVAVPYPPRPPPVELVPARPATPEGLVWADGGWEWDGERFRWIPGSWVSPPAGAQRARWVIVRRHEDGQLFFAPSSWRDAAGKPIGPPPPLARAGGGGGGGGGASRPGGPAGGALDD